MPKPDLRPHLVCQEIHLVDQISAGTDVLKQQETPDLLREPEVNVQPAFLIDKDTPENRGDLPV
jgi:hypothetical protein